MASPTQGIQQLLVAEKRAAEKVAEARKRKARRIKQAKEEAQLEIEKYRQERDRQYLEYEKKKLGSKEDIQARIDKNTAVLIEDMSKDVEKNKDLVLSDLLDLVYDIRPMVHPNYFVMNPFALRRIGQHKN